MAAFRDTMNLAQEMVMVARRAGGDPRQLRAAWVAQLLAMSQFERALTSYRLPIPRRLRQEARLLRRLLA